MRNVITIRLDNDLAKMLDRVCHRSGQKRNEVIRDALRRQLSMLLFDQIRDEIRPSARKRGFRTDQDVFRKVS